MELFRQIWNGGVDEGWKRGEKIRKEYASGFREMVMSTEDGVGNAGLKVDQKQRNGHA